MQEACEHEEVGIVIEMRSHAMVCLQARAEIWTAVRRVSNCERQSQGQKCPSLRPDLFDSMHVTIAARKEAGCRPNSKGGGVTSAYLKCRRYMSVHVRVSSTYYHLVRVCFFISDDTFTVGFSRIFCGNLCCSFHAVSMALAQAYAEQVLIV